MTTRTRTAYNLGGTENYVPAFPWLNIMKGAGTHAMQDNTLNYPWGDTPDKPQVYQLKNNRYLVPWIWRADKDVWFPDGDYFLTWTIDDINLAVTGTGGVTLGSTSAAMVPTRSGMAMGWKRSVTLAGIQANRYALYLTSTAVNGVDDVGVSSADHICVYRDNGGVDEAMLAAGYVCRPEMKAVNKQMYLVRNHDMQSISNFNIDSNADSGLGSPLTEATLAQFARGDNVGFVMYDPGTGGFPTRTPVEYMVRLAGECGAREIQWCVPSIMSNAGLLAWAQEAKDTETALISAGIVDSTWRLTNVISINDENWNGQFRRNSLWGYKKAVAQGLIAYDYLGAQSFDTRALEYAGDMERLFRAVQAFRTVFGNAYVVIQLEDQESNATNFGHGGPWYFYEGMSGFQNYQRPLQLDGDARTVVELAGDTAVNITQSRYALAPYFPPQLGTGGGNALGSELIAAGALSWNHAQWRTVFTNCIDNQNLTGVTNALLAVADMWPGGGVVLTTYEAGPDLAALHDDFGGTQPLRDACNEFLNSADGQDLFVYFFNTICKNKYLRAQGYTNISTNNFGWSQDTSGVLNVRQKVWRMLGQNVGTSINGPFT